MKLSIVAVVVEVVTASVRRHVDWDANCASVIAEFESGYASYRVSEMEDVAQAGPAGEVDEVGKEFVAKYATATNECDLRTCVLAVRTASFRRLFQLQGVPRDKLFSVDVLLGALQELPLGDCRVDDKLATLVGYSDASQVAPDDFRPLVPPLAKSRCQLGWWMSQASDRSASSREAVSGIYALLGAGTPTQCQADVCLRLINAATVSDALLAGPNGAKWTQLMTAAGQAAEMAKNSCDSVNAKTDFERINEQNVDAVLDLIRNAVVPAVIPVEVDSRHASPHGHRSADDDAVPAKRAGAGDVLSRSASLDKPSSAGSSVGDSYDPSGVVEQYRIFGSQGDEDDDEETA